MIWSEAAEPDGALVRVVVQAQARQGGPRDGGVVGEGGDVEPGRTHLREGLFGVARPVRVQRVVVQVGHHQGEPAGVDVRAGR